MELYEIKHLKQNINQILLRGNSAEIDELVKGWHESAEALKNYLTTDLFIFDLMTTIYQVELQNEVAIPVLGRQIGLEELVREFHEVKFLFYRFEFTKEDNYLNDLTELKKIRKLSIYYLNAVATVVIFDKKSINNILINILELKETRCDEGD